MNNKKNIFFDLDGTLINSQKGIYYSLRYSFDKVGIKQQDDNQLMRFIGPPLLESYVNYCNVDKQKAKEAYSYFREAYSDIGIKQNELYVGIDNMLCKLHKADKILIVATSKPEEFAKTILSNLKVDKYFTDICGATLSETRTDKQEVLKYALKKNYITDIEKAVMIGDRKHDIVGAKAVGMQSIGVLYGFGNIEELSDVGATWIAKTPNDILNIIDNTGK